ncbi:MAG: hypothetical protein AABM67_06095 [Acidobacteriota bacterium]
MIKRLSGVFGATLLLLSLAALAVAQTPTTTTTKTEAIQNPDGTYTIVEYPVGKETIVTLSPIGLSGATGTATILRAADGTTIKVNLASLPNEVKAVNLYAIDPAGKVTLLGPIALANNAGTSTTSTPLTKFMLVASPDDKLSAYNDSTPVFFRSAVPTGLTVIPITNAVGEQVGAVVVPATIVTAPTETAAAPTTVAVTTPAAAPTTVTVKTPAAAPTTVAVTTPAAAPTTVATVPTTEAAPETVAVVASDYTVPMLGIGNFKKGDDTKLTINFTGAMEGARANIFIEPHKKGTMTEVRMRFHDLKEAPKGTAYILWAVSPTGEFAKLGQIVNVKGRNEAEIKSEVAFEDFGLLLTTEDLAVTTGTIIKPSGQRVGVIQLIP